MGISRVRNFHKQNPDWSSTWKWLAFATIAIMLVAPLISNSPAQQASAASCAVLPISRVTAVGNEVGNVPGNVVDGKLSTRWSNEGIGSWINIGLGKLAKVCYVDIAWYKGNTRQNTFTISHSADTKSYSQVFSGKSSGTTTGFERYDFTDRTTKNIRITVKGNTENNWASITEVKVYGYFHRTHENNFSRTQENTMHHTLTVRSVDLSGNAITGMHATVRSSSGTVLQTGDTPLTFTGNTGSKYSVTVAEHGEREFDHWDNGATIMTRTVKLSKDTTVTAYYGSVQSLSTTSPADGSNDRFGIKMIYPTAKGGMVWESKWDNGIARTFGNTKNDPYDPLFKTSKNGGGLGDGSYKTQGDGILKISGKYPRMYVFDGKSDWTNVEITVYGMRVSDSNIAWAGIQAYARTNHGAIGDEDENNCDTRGYSAQLTYPGKFLFEKETSHHSGNGYAQVGQKTLWSGGMPKNAWIGYKFIVRDVDNGQHVKLEAYMDTTGGKDGGNWVKVAEFTDTGSNFGTKNASCKSGVRAGLPLTSSDDREGSETGRPNAAVYFRSDGVGQDGLLYKWASIREIAPLP
ncbi:MAG TPA: discoidin domain-containing protein [Nitrososphaera sp.]|jgi:hypothetical protein